jgi:glycosyltransferase involved in cell wall biosynthesis
VPIVFWTDATFAAMVGFNPAFRGLAKETIRDGNAGEQAALDTSALALYASDWAAESARSRYRVDPAKVRVVPFGANLPAEPEPERVAAAIAGRPAGVCHLVFVAVEWENKDGATAVATAAELIRRGIPATLTVVGVQPPPGLPSFVEYAGFVDKHDPSQVAHYEAVLERSHLLIVPSRAEAFGIVYAEASAHGVPSLARRVGGVPTAVRDGINGYLLAPDADAAAFADAAEGLVRDPAAYASLARSSFEEYRTRLNWAVAGRTVRELLRGLVATG